MNPGAGLLYHLFTFHFIICPPNTGEVRSVIQRPLMSKGHRQEWKCFVEYFNNDKKEYVLPSPAIRVQLSAEEAREGVETLKPQPFNGNK
jgi:hypothetical protein